jgi:hypothetical protein
MPLHKALPQGFSCSPDPPSAYGENTSKAGKENHDLFFKFLNITSSFLPLLVLSPTSTDML